MPLFVTFGMIMAIMIFLSFVAAVIMLPALLFRFGNLEGDRPPPEPSVVPEPKEPLFNRKPRLLKKVKKRRLPNPN